jgi:DNA-binding CsgD family transcriptional regulator/PAS domain-containing protein
MADDLSPQALSNLIGSIYDCALDPSLWDQTLIEISNILDTHNAVLGLINRRQGRSVVSKVVGIEPYWLQQVEERHSAEIATMTARALASISSLDDPQVMSWHVPREYLEASPYVQECLKPQGLVDILQYILIHTPARFGVFAAARNERQGLITRRQTEIGALLLPHIRRAVTISDVLDARTIERNRATEALDVLRCAVIMTDGRGTILHANRAADDMLREGKLAYVRGGVLHANNSAAADELRRAVRLAAQDEAGIGSAGLAICLTAPEMMPIFGHVLPMTGGNLRTRLQPSAVAAVFIGEPPDAQDNAELVGAVYSLTPAETRVLASLLAGRTLAQTAASLDIAETTARTHLNSIFSKTGVSRQADLMRLGAGVVAPTRARP